MYSALDSTYMCPSPFPPALPAGTLLHFEDHGLKNIYFLDPQWLAKLMADVIRPAAVEEGSPIQNGQSEALCSRNFMYLYT